ncbi:hypothetical protein E5D08_27570 [Klebsiella pneumoniae]|uniref:hypothetical protein n=1 Tax=Klebsiella TaxID=570 RepID=UPI000E2AF38C|nr:MULTISPECIES: hypothetical protein [Klebsiella]HBQ5717398.1 hypothetical protein [Klebsiella pneumoniae subsp. pneumoniae]HDT3050616.1 hypothetical protein [Klebsiella pneumoniae subsp. ozaenae]EIW9593989.1 hypothetical protein [Klebsiella pneumoniae]EIX9226152.1 hypothetical protein [Klebsiella pneumoniae]ELC0851495.1 hypothetical protein [Klebsiella pneumoniae]
MTILKVHYSPTDEIPLNSLYLKETSTTERSGSVLGGGISGDSVILGGGGYAGSEIQKTTRSTVFAPPDEVTAEPDNSKMMTRISFVIGRMIVLVFITLITNGIIDSFAVNLSQTTASFLENAPFFIIVLSVFCSLFVIRLTDHDYTPVVEEHKRNEERLSVYHRLRYVEADNIIFDPKSMNGCYAERKFITLLVESCISK